MMPPFYRRHEAQATMAHELLRSRGAGGVSGPLNAWHRDPFAHRPDMIGQARRHRRRPPPPVTLVVTFVECSHRPAEVIAVHREVGHRLVDPPVLAERVGL